MKNIKTSSITEWVEMYSTELYSWAAHKVSDSELAKDLVQDTFLAAAEKIDGFKGNSTPKTWLFSILNNKIIDFYRKKAHQPLKKDTNILSEFFDGNERWKSGRVPHDWHEDENHLLDNHDFRDILRQCLEELPDKWNACVQLKFLENKKGEDICQDIGITPSNFWQIIHRAKLQLRDCIENNWFDS
jgi:RNA polymerase sigma-70 factor (TIGR02943 family)